MSFDARSLLDASTQFPFLVPQSSEAPERPSQFAIADRPYRRALVQRHAYDDRPHGGVNNHHEDTVKHGPGNLHEQRTTVIYTPTVRAYVPSHKPRLISLDLFTEY